MSLHEDALHLGKLVDDLHLLAMSNLQSLPCRFERLDALENLQRAVAKGLALSVGTVAPKALPVRWDRARIEQLPGTLLENSLRQGQRIFIDIADGAPGVRFRPKPLSARQDPSAGCAAQQPGLTTSPGTALKQM